MEIRTKKYIEYGNRIIKQYKKVGLDTKEQTIIFSDGITVAQAEEVHNYFKSKIQCSFGINAQLPKDIEITNYLQIATKLIDINKTFL